MELKSPKLFRLNENVEVVEERGSNYMFWQNLKTIHHAVGELLEMDKEHVDSLIENGHAWAVDHVATSADDLEEVYHFLESEGDGVKLSSELVNEAKEVETESDFVVSGVSGGFDRDQERYDYIVTAKNKVEAKQKLKNKKSSLRKITATPTKEFKSFDPYSTFEKLK